MAISNNCLAVAATFFLVSSCILPTYQLEENKAKTDEKSTEDAQKSDHEKSVEKTNTNVDASSKNDKKVSVGDQTTQKMWEFTQSAFEEINRLDGVVLKKENDLITAAFPLLDKYILPAKRMMEFNVCDNNLSKELDEFMKSEYNNIRRCKRMSQARDKFHSTVETAMKFLDDLLKGVVEEVSICEQLKGEEADDCFSNTYKLAEHKKYYFKSGELVHLKHEAEEAMDKVENHWMGCIVRAMSAVKKVNAILEKKLRCCQRGIYNRGDCIDLDLTFKLTVTIKPEIDDLEMYYIEIKQQDL